MPLELSFTFKFDAHVHGCVRDLDDEAELEDLVEDDSMSSIASRGPYASQMMRARRSSSNAATLWASESAVLSRQLFQPGRRH